ncbi:MAG: cytochrome ubiquinol oxidase subunit I [Nitrososphaerota archaeon]|nr:cytochrome ubiquinol oxidase subunit I [Candidatus Calditenuaceae archaeon]MDW8074061.1 cytochrome ubiquinol oxidase subunit I [Nitrososphaerota archaeon]
MLAANSVSLLMPISALGIYLHAIFVSITLGFPFVIGAFLFKWWRTRDEDYYRAARTATGVLAVNFALGAITGTLVEFGLVQAWPGTIYAIATVAFVPLAAELVAFVGEIVFLVAFIVTLRRVRPWFSILLLGGYFAFAAFSGALITIVNSWINVPWGTGALASVLYPYLPEYGPAAFDTPVLVKVKLALVDTLLKTGTASQILQSPEVAQAVGISLKDPFVALYSPYALVSVLHNVTAAVIIGMAIASAALAYRHLRAGDQRYVKLLRSFLPILLVLLIVQPTVFGDSMGKAVAEFMPTKFAMMEGAATTMQNPLVAFLAYGDPSKPIPGFDAFRKACEAHGDTTVGGIAPVVVTGYSPGPSSNIRLRDLCLRDLAAAEGRLALINGAYYVKIGAGVVALVSVVALTSSVFNLGPLSKVVSILFGRLGGRRLLFLLAILVLLGSILPAALGWYVREVGRKPWTVYGLLYPEELVTPTPVSAATMAAFTTLFTAMSVGGIVGMYLVATRPLEFVRLLRRGAGVEE